VLVTHFMDEAEHLCDRVAVVDKGRVVALDTPQRLIDWTGERCVPWADDVQMIYEHLARYHLAARIVAGRRVVDLGSGEGYGAAILAETAAEVVGVEIDAASVEHSRRTHRRPNLGFVQGSVLDARSYGDPPFDVVVCFEVLEHLVEQERLLDTIGEVLAGDGVLFISTPDRDVYSAPGTVPNPFHVRELSRAEFSDVLSSRFAHLAVWGQWAVTGARLALLPQGPRPDGGAAVTVARRGEAWEPVAPPAPAYLIAAASRVALPPLPAEWELWDHGLELAAGPRHELGAAHARIAALEAEVARLSAAAPAPPPPRPGLIARGLELARSAGRGLRR